MPNIPSSNDTELWESRQLGATEKFVRKVSAARERAVDETIGLQPITIRLQKELVDELKALASAHGIGYQPYARLVLTRHVRTQKKLRSSSDDHYVPFDPADYVSNPISLARLKARVRQNELANLLGVTPAFLKKAEKQETVSPKLLERVKEALSKRSKTS
jgi:hypothetical protein